jgi:hypothetical protein
MFPKYLHSQLLKKVAGTALLFSLAAHPYATFTLVVRHNQIKVKFALEQATKAQRGEQRYSSTLSLTSALDWVVIATPRPLYPRKRPGTHCVGGWVGPRAGLDGCKKSRPPPGFVPWTVQRVTRQNQNWYFILRQLQITL